ncbi:MAG: hypothetical protein AB8B64_25195 [Granulosicoccus sp.]
MFERLSRSSVIPILLLFLLFCASIAVPFVSNGQEWLADILFLRNSAEEHQWVSWLWFSLAVLVSQLLVVPSGSALMLFGGFLLGAPEATLIFSTIQLLATILLVWLGRRSGVEKLAHSLSGWSVTVEKTMTTLDRVPLMLGIVLRLFPVLPSAIACLLSVVFTIPLCTFLLATALVGWIRPLLFASAGALIPSFLDIEASRSDIVVSVLWPATLLFCSGVILLFIRIWLTRRTGAHE